MDNTDHLLIIKYFDLLDFILWQSSDSVKKTPALLDVFRKLKNFPFALFFILITNLLLNDPNLEFLSNYLFCCFLIQITILHFKKIKLVIFLSKI